MHHLLVLPVNVLLFSALKMFNKYIILNQIKKNLSN